MTGCLAFVGGDEWSAECAVHQELAASGGADAITLLPTAAAFEDPDALTRRAQRRLAEQGLGCTVIRALTKHDASDPVAVAAVRSARCLWFSSGSALHLRTVLKGTELWEAATAAWRGGATLVGSGGAAMAFADPMIDPRGGAYTLGLGLVEGIAVLTEADTWTSERRRRVLRMAGPETVIALIDARAALIHDAGAEGGWRTAGRVELQRGGRAVGIDALPGC